MSVRAVVGTEAPHRFPSAFVPTGRIRNVSTASIADAAFDAHAYCGWGPSECEVCRMRAERRLSRRRA